MDELIPVFLPRSQAAPGSTPQVPEGELPQCRSSSPLTIPLPSLESWIPKGFRLFCSRKLGAGSGTSGSSGIRGNPWRKEELYQGGQHVLGFPDCARLPALIPLDPMHFHRELPACCAGFTLIPPLSQANVSHPRDKNKSHQTTRTSRPGWVPAGHQISLIPVSVPEFPMDTAAVIPAQLIPACWYPGKLHPCIHASISCSSKIHG